MTLRLVADNVSELPVYNFQDIANCARRFADQMEAAKQGEPIRAVLVLQMTDGTMPISIWGDFAEHIELMGLFEAAKLRVFADAAFDDD